jgi:hypothetical protein
MIFFFNKYLIEYREGFTRGEYYVYTYIHAYILTYMRTYEYTYIHG